MPPSAPRAALEPRLANPYKGLRAVRRGRRRRLLRPERLVERLVARFGETGTRGRFVAVVGPSGSGKSSVVKAGLLPALRGGRRRRVGGTGS